MKSKGSDKEWRFTNQNWKKVLSEIYNYAPNKYGRGRPQSYGDDHPLVKRLKVKPYELSLIMSFLEDQGLVEYDKPEYNWINLTSKGFDVALQNQTQQAAFRTSFVMIVFTAILAFSAVVTLVNAGLPWEAQVALLAFAVGLGCILWKSAKRGI